MPDENVTVPPGGGDAAPIEPSYDAAAIAHIQQTVPAAVAAAGPAPAPSLWQQLLALVLGFLAGVGGKVHFAIPGLPASVHVGFAETFTALGKTWTLDFKLANGNLTITLSA